MTCSQVQLNLSLYVYGELDFGEEEQLEQHLDTCAACQLALAREKEWHARSRSSRPEVPFELLSDCRRELKAALKTDRPRRFALPEMRWRNLFGFTNTRWSAQVALASFMVFVGFAAGRFVEHFGIPGATGSLSTMGLLDTGNAHVREISPSGANRVRIVVDQVREHELTGSLDDAAVRKLLLAAVREPLDPGLRMDSVAILDSQDGSDVRDALAFAARHDANAAVRLKALEGLRRFSGDPVARESLRFVLQHDADPNVRSEAIDVLAPRGQVVNLSPDLADMLEQVVRSPQQDDYVRARCYQLLESVRAASPVY